MAYPWKLEFSEDDLSVSNAAATRVDISDLVKAGTLRWKAGTDALGDEPRAGEMSFTLLGRDFEPLYADSPYYPNVKRKRRFFLSFDTGSGFVDEFVGYARTYQPVWPGNVTQQEIDVVCGDGFDILSDARLPALDPPDATTYPGVIDHDEPTFYYRLGEPQGTKVVAHARRRKRRKEEGKQHYRRHGIKRWRTRETRAEVEGVAGPAGTYRNTPGLGEPGLILGDSDTAVLLRSAQTEFVYVPIEDNEFADRNAVSISAWVNLTTRTGTSTVISASKVSGISAPIFKLEIDSNGNVFFRVFDAAGSASLATAPANSVVAGTIVHLAGTWDGTTIRLYVDGALAGESISPRAMASPDSGFLFFRLGRSTDGGSDNLLNGVLDEVAIFDKGLTAERVLAHYQAGAERGYAEETAGERILDAATHTLWDASGITASAFTIAPRMKYGQSPLEVIEEAMAAEGLQTIFGFDGSGDPFYLGWEWKADSPYNEVQAVFGAPRQGSELHFDSEALRFDDAIYNEATLSHDGGDAVHVVDEASQDEHGPAVAEPVTGLLTMEHADVERLGGELMALYAQPTWALDALTLHGSDADQEEQIFALGLGRLIRYKRRAVDETTGNVGDAIDVVTHVLGYEKQLEAGDVVTATFKLARGFNAGVEGWRMGIVGFSEIGETTTLG